MVTHAQTQPGSNPLLAGPPAILVVEDDTELLKILEESLVVEGFSVVGAYSVAKALALLSSQPVSVVLLDWDLSHGRSHPAESGTGGAVLKACRERDPLLPVIVMSGQQAMDVRTDAVLAEADSFLAKPFGLALLANHLRHWLNRVSAARSPWKLTCEADILPFDEVRRRYTVEVVNLLGGNVAATARKLNLHRHTVAALLGAPAAKRRQPGSPGRAPAPTGSRARRSASRPRSPQCS